MTTRSIRGPVVALSEAAVRASEGDYNQHVAFEARSELGTQTRVFNMMVKAIREQTEIIRQKNEENEQLLLNILPAPIAGRLKSGERTIADAYGEVSVLFADIVGFTRFSAGMPVSELVNMLNELFSGFDAAAVQEGVEKIQDHRRRLHGGFRDAVPMFGPHGKDRKTGVQHDGLGRPL